MANFWNPFLFWEGWCKNVLIINSVWFVLGKWSYNDKYRDVWKMLIKEISQFEFSSHQSALAVWIHSSARANSASAASGEKQAWNDSANANESRIPLQHEGDHSHTFHFTPKTREDPSSDLNSAVTHCDALYSYKLKHNCAAPLTVC